MEQDEQAQRRQIERLLGFPGVGALPAGAITANLGVPEGTLGTILDDLVARGRVVRTPDGRYAMPIRGRRA